jgi:allophanate hydrolase
MADSSALGSLDLATLARLYRTRSYSPQRVMERVLDRLDAYPDPAVWIYRLPHAAVLDQARAVERRRAAGEDLPLSGVPFAVKDNFDVAGHPTTAACPAFSYVPESTAPVVARLTAAGAVLVGKTNMDQFATGLAGDRTPYGVCRNVFDPAHIAGGSSSGSAVAVAAGLVTFALGTDTAGSGRVPAGCSNIVSLKPAPGRLSTRGVVPACRSLDCVSVFALTVEDARLVYETAGHPEPTGGPVGNGTNGAALTFATPRDEDLEFFGDPGQERLFREALARLEQTGGRRLAIDFGPFRETAGLLYEGPWLAERLAGLDEFVKAPGAEMHPVTRAIIAGGARYSAVDVFKGLDRLQALRETCLQVFDRAEVLVVPTMPTLPTRAEVEADSAGWSRRLGHYTNFANLLGLAAVAVQAGFTPRGLPGGLTLLGPGGSERRLAELGMAWQRRLNLPFGATGKPLPAPGPVPTGGPAPAVSEGFVRLAVAGAHLRGQPLHADLGRAGACFVRACRTAARYRFFAWTDLCPPRPGLLRDDKRAGAVAVEVYDLPFEGFGRLVASVAPPLAIGTIELEDGEAVKGFLCEPAATTRARDITEFGGWVAFREHLARLSPQRHPC